MKYNIYFFITVSIFAQQIDLGHGDRIGSVKTLSHFKQVMKEQLQNTSLDKHFRLRLWRSYAELLELQGNISEARDAFLHVYKETQQEEFILRAAILAIELGYFSQACEQLKGITKDSLASDVQLHLLRVFGFTHTLEEVWEAAYRLTEKFSTPAIYYYGWEIAHRLHREKEKVILEKKLLAQFPESPEYMLIKVRKGDYLASIQDEPSPSRLLHLSTLPATRVTENNLREKIGIAKQISTVQKTSIPYGMQVASFSQKENASNLRIELQQDGFSIKIVGKNINSTLFYRVFIENDKKLSTQDFIVLLRVKNIEGVLFNDAPSELSAQD